VGQDGDESEEKLRTSPPRPVLTKIPPGFIRSNCSRPIISRVSSLSGQCKLTTSASASSSLRLETRRCGMGAWPEGSDGVHLLGGEVGE